MFIIGLGTATPPKCYSQNDCWLALEAAEQFAHLSPRSRAILKKVLRGNNGIVTRHLALDPLSDAFQLEADALHERFAKNAPALAIAAAKKALEQAGITPQEIDALLISTCTGYLCPGLTSYVSEGLGLKHEAFLLDLVGQGCGAAIPNLRTGEALIQFGRSKKILSICVEVCSAAFYLDNDPGVLISACLFGDGAGALVLSDKPSKNLREISWISSHSITVPSERDLLRFEQKNGMLRNILKPEVPSLASNHFEEVLSQTLQNHNLSSADIQSWIVHAGGRDVLLALQERMKLSSEAFCLSAKVLQNFGNLSSPFVYFVLEEALRRNSPPGYWWLATFGAGFSSHGALLAVS